MKERLEKFCKDVCSKQSAGVCQLTEDGVTIQVDILNASTYRVTFFEHSKTQLQTICGSYKHLRYEVLEYFGIEA